MANLCWKKYPPQKKSVRDTNQIPDLSWNCWCDEVLVSTRLRPIAFDIVYTSWFLWILGREITLKISRRAVMSSFDFFFFNSCKINKRSVKELLSCYCFLLSVLIIILAFFFGEICFHYGNISLTITTSQYLTFLNEWLYCFQSINLGSRVTSILLRSEHALWS